MVLSTKQKIKMADAENILKGIKEVYSSRGKKVIHLKIETIKKQKNEIEKIMIQLLLLPKLEPKILHLIKLIQIQP